MMEVINCGDNIQYTITDATEVHGDRSALVEYLNQSVNTCKIVSVTTEDKSETEKGKLFFWTSSKTNLLLDFYLERKSQFRDPKIKKKLLWSEICQGFLEKGYKNVNEEMLDRKMRNIKKTYKSICDSNKESTGRGTITWEFFPKCKEIFGEDKPIIIEQTLSSMETIPIEIETTVEDDDVTAQKLHSRKRRIPSDKQELCNLRKKIMLIEEKKIKQLEELTEKVNISNAIQLERNTILKQILDKL